MKRSTFLHFATPQGKGLNFLDLGPLPTQKLALALIHIPWRTYTQNFLARASSKSDQFFRFNDVFAEKRLCRRSPPPTRIGTPPLPHLRRKILDPPLTLHPENIQNTCPCMEKEQRQARTHTRAHVWFSSQGLSGILHRYQLVSRDYVLIVLTKQADTVTYRILQGYFRSPNNYGNFWYFIRFQ